MSRTSTGVAYTRAASPMKSMVRSRSMVKVDSALRPACRLLFIITPLFRSQTHVGLLHLRVVQ